MSIPTLYLDKIQDAAQISEGKAKKLMETCVWCLVASEHSNGVTLEVNQDDATLSYLLSWPTGLDLEALTAASIKTTQ